MLVKIINYGHHISRVTAHTVHSVTQQAAVVIDTLNKPCELFSVSIEARQTLVYKNVGVLVGGRHIELGIDMCFALVYLCFDAIAFFGHF